jgi:hypothetical protein
MIDGRIPTGADPLHLFVNAASRNAGRIQVLVCGGLDRE